MFKNFLKIIFAIFVVRVVVELISQIISNKDSVPSELIFLLLLIVIFFAIYLINRRINMFDWFYNNMFGDWFDWEDIWVVALVSSIVITIVLIICTSLPWLYTIVWLPIVIFLALYLINRKILKSFDKKNEERAKLEEREECISYLVDNGFGEREYFESLEYHDISTIYKDKKRDKQREKEEEKRKKEEEKREREEEKRKKEKEEEKRRKKEVQEELEGLSKEEQKERKKCISYLVVNELGKREYFESLGYYDILAKYEKAIADKEKEAKILEAKLKRLTKYKDTSGDDIDIEIIK